MKQNKILLTGYKKAKSDTFSSTEALLEKINDKYDKFLFNNDFEMIDKEAKEILKRNYDYVIMFGWKANITKLSIEIVAINNDEYLYTNFLLEKILRPLRVNNIKYTIKEAPGNSFCNHAYYQVLNNIKQEGLKTKVIFIHIPWFSKFKQVEEFVNMVNNYDF